VTEDPRRGAIVIDLFCGGGGSSVGWWLAGAEAVVGVDWLPQRHYPFEFVQDDVMALDLGVVVDRVSSRWPGAAVVVAASPPCQAYSVATPRRFRHRHADLVAETRRRLSSLVAGGVASAWVIENVPQAPMPDAVTLCGQGLGLGVRRHRLFESSVPLLGVPCAHGSGRVASVVGGYGGPSRDRYVTADEGRVAMDIGWLPWPALTQAVPPIFAQVVGGQVFGAIGVGVASGSSREIRQLAPRCRCGLELRRSVTGRWPVHCSQRCRQAAYVARVLEASVIPPAACVTSWP
jgi:DNA (cytosine-5)-methyltransferase 1